MTLHPRPRLSLHMMVLNGAAVVERAIRPLLDVVDEVCLVDTGSTDGTFQAIGKLLEGTDIGFNWILVNPSDNLHFLDESSSFRRHVPDLFTGLPLLRDWSAPRNRGLDLCTGQYVMKLDADDECLDPDKISRTLDFLDENPDVDFLACPYEVMDPSSKKRDYVTLYTRLWRNKPEIRFREVCHENVDYLRRGTNWRLVGGLAFRDWRDSPGDGVRVAHRNYKVLLREYERLEVARVQPSGHLLAYLAEEAIRVDPRFADDLASRLLGSDYTHADRAWFLTIRGESAERLGRHADAKYYYDRAASLGSMRASLLRGMLVAGMPDLRKEVSRGWAVDEWRAMLQAALLANCACFYPRGASVTEMERAKCLLEEGENERSQSVPRREIHE